MRTESWLPLMLYNILGDICVMRPAPSHKKKSLASRLSIESETSQSIRNDFVGKGAQ
jgi:hypothetical protein